MLPVDTVRQRGNMKECGHVPERALLKDCLLKKRQSFSRALLESDAPGIPSLWSGSSFRPFANHVVGINCLPQLLQFLLGNVLLGIDGRQLLELRQSRDLDFHFRDSEAKIRVSRLVITDLGIEGQL
ncbi:unnamed protein product [Symbiodinium sp. CCMP2592]|nr:unnamed protein product [Symbiodinium sp. CCMP2592]